MMLEYTVSIICSSAFILLSLSTASAQECSECGVVIEWSSSGGFPLVSKGRLEPRKVYLGSCGYKLEPINVVCYKFTVSNKLPLSEDSVRVASVVTHNTKYGGYVFNLDMLEITGLCDTFQLSAKTKVLQSAVGEREATFSVAFKIGNFEDDTCFQRDYKFSMMSDLEAKVERYEPKEITCSDHSPLPKHATRPRTDDTEDSAYKSFSPSGTFYQTEFDDKPAENGVLKISGAIKTIIKCKKTLLPRLKIIYVANVIYDGLVIDRLKVTSCVKEMFKASIQLGKEKITKDETDVEVTIKKMDGNCYKRSYKIKENNDERFSLPELSVSRSTPEKIECPSNMKSKADSRSWKWSGSGYKKDYVRYIYHE